VAAVSEQRATLFRVRDDRVPSPFVKRRSSWFALGSALVVSSLYRCKTTQSPAPVARVTAATIVARADAATAPVVDAATDAGPAAARDVCAAVQARSAQVLATIPPTNAWREQLQTFGRCERTTRGAWAIVLDELRPIADAEGAYEGTWAIVHVDDAGREVRAPRRGTWRDYMNAELQSITLFDYDGDGEQELLWSVHTNVNEGPELHESGVMTFKQGAIAALANTAEVSPTAFEDVDNDGRPDLVGSAPYVGEGDDSPSGFSYNMNDPSLLWRSLPDGTFARDDAAAQQYARRACAARVNTVFARTGEIEASTAVVCARLWGVAPAAVHAAINGRCESVAEAESARASRRARCGDVRVLHRWVDFRPPLSLR
jgi:hypothetical protein